MYALSLPVPDLAGSRKVEETAILCHVQILLVLARSSTEIMTTGKFNSSTCVCPQGISSYSAPEFGTVLNLPYNSQNEAKLTLRNSTSAITMTRSSNEPFTCNI